MMRELTSEAQWNQYEEELELDFAYGIAGVGRYRANYFNQASGVAAVFRLIPEQVASLKDLEHAAGGREVRAPARRARARHRPDRRGQVDDAARRSST